MSRPYKALLAGSAIRRSLNDITLAQLAGLDNRAMNLPVERELKYMGRAKVAT